VETRGTITRCIWVKPDPCCHLSMGPSSAGATGLCKRPTTVSYWLSYSGTSRSWGVTVSMGCLCMSTGDLAHTEQNQLDGNQNMEAYENQN
jgi:hypothetical protein